MIVVKMDKKGRVHEVLRSEKQSPGFQGFDAEGNIIWAVDVDNAEIAVKIVDEWRRTILAYGAWKDPEAIKEIFRIKGGQL